MVYTVHKGFKDVSNSEKFYLVMNNYIVKSYRDVIVVTKIATRRISKAQSIVMY